jgi:hypothetical protein
MTELTQDLGSTSTTDEAGGGAGEAAHRVAEQGHAVAHTAASEARDVADHAKDQLTSLTVEGRDQAMAALASASAEVEAQLDERLGAATSLARTTAEELRALCEGRPDDAGRTAELAHQASVRLDRFAERTDQLGVRGAAEELADFGRRRPVAFLVGAAIGGVLVGRLARAGQRVGQDSSNGAGAEPQWAAPSPAMASPTAPAQPAMRPTGAAIPPVATADADVAPLPVIDNPPIATPHPPLTGGPAGTGPATPGGNR